MSLVSTEISVLSASLKYYANYFYFSIFFICDSKHIYARVEQSNLESLRNKNTSVILKEVVVE